MFFLIHSTQYLLQMDYNLSKQVLFNVEKLISIDLTIVRILSGSLIRNLGLFLLLRFEISKKRKKLASIMIYVQSLNSPSGLSPFAFQFIKLILQLLNGYLWK